ncbi:MAG TPA: type II secretion system protein [Phycisphaerae bacterium]|nr:type II secretion system protein [Phycisphaerae bacterium]
MKNARDNRISRRAGGGFSLVEMLLAIGILGACLAMTASLFPPAVKEAADAQRDVLGTIICQNALGVCKAKLTHDGNGLSTPLQWVASLTENDKKYADTTTAGFEAFRSRLADKENDYLLLIITWRKQAGGNVSVQTVAGATVANSGDTSELTVPAGTLQIGCPVFNPATGEFAKIAAVTTGTTALLDHRIPAFSGTVYLLKEDGAAFSPALSVLATRTALRP